MNNRVNLIFSLSALFMFLLASCGGDSSQPPKAPKKDYNYEKADSLSSDYLRELGNIRVSIEETAKLNKLLRNNGFSYKGSVLNSSSRASGYSSSKKQALNLGVYGSDLNYATAYEQNQDVVNCMKAMVTLSDKLGIKAAFNEELLQKLSGSDSTVNKSVLLTQAYLQAEDQLYSNERAQWATLMVAGGWAEGMYISTSIMVEKAGNGEINTSLWNHAFTYKNVIKMLEVFESSNQDCKEVLEEMRKIKGPVNQLLETQGAITTEHVKKLHEPLTALRNTLTN